MYRCDTLIRYFGNNERNVAVVSLRLIAFHIFNATISYRTYVHNFSTRARQRRALIITRVQFCPRADVSARIINGDKEYRRYFLFFFFLQDLTEKCGCYRSRVCKELSTWVIFRSKGVQLRQIPFLRHTDKNRIPI